MSNSRQEANRVKNGDALNNYETRIQQAVATLKAVKAEIIATRAVMAGNALYTQDDLDDIDALSQAGLDLIATI